MIETIKSKKFSNRKFTNTKSLFLSENIVADISNAIEQGKYKGKVKGEWSRYIQNWEYYPNCNVVNFLCTNIQGGNLTFFTKRIQGLVSQHEINCCDCDSRNHRYYFHLNKGEREIRFTLNNDNSINSFTVHHWLNEPLTY